MITSPLSYVAKCTFGILKNTATKLKDDETLTEIFSLPFSVQTMTNRLRIERAPLEISNISKGQHSVEIKLRKSSPGYRLQTTKIG